MRVAPERLPLVVKVARLYHEHGLRQPEIAARLNMSQSRVSRLLKEGVEAGIVRTIVVEPPGMFSELEDRLRDAYDLRDVVVAGGPDESAESDAALLSAIGSAGARYLESTMLPSDRVGLSSWSASLLAVVDAMTPRTTRTAERIVQVIGGVGDPRAQVQATRLADRLAQVTGAEVHYFNAPGVVSSQEVRDSLLSDPQIAAVRGEWRDLTMALVGIGSVQPSALLVSSGSTLPDRDLQSLAERGAVGDVCLNFFDAEGVHVESDLVGRTLGIDETTLKTIPRRIAVAGGRRKLEAIRGALVGGWCDVLITDSVTARNLLEA
ncbi:DNA-binding transcriptional regulator [Tessaracoccus lapidicaptus]|uniref:DNA-binding transcriptional regulator n=1 Tax=Tessaracoccus lapidicaptus TaxID=1427523 RepID=A0A1C0AIK5_9ACTN|nr:MULTISPECIES: sugar-binding transcriptional regulator [Tessaracoccus]AQX15646.1 DNA-binding transcriptional regulator [Tessaracoccus sp. T2.5-30]OCL31929.1 DNA-binding transcriptional regulator [Tessaracoccus lapidicaptus]VEP40025.1 Deoxyribonucleoside regulator [Tessaracoccus lapidicaptus]